MQIKIDNIWNDKESELFLFTGNSYVNKSGELVMGRGLALQFKEKYPWMPRYFGHEIQTTCKHLGEYNLIIAIGRFMEFRLYGVFQVKYHFKDNADLKLIERSVVKLNDFITKSNIKSVALNYPGIGWGHRQEKEILPIIAKLSDKVTIYKME